MKNEIWSWIGDLSQVAGIKHYELRSGRAKGTEAFDVRTGAGLAFTVVKDRALDIAWASYKDTALSFITPNGVVAPAFFESQGNGFLRSFYAGLLTTCGLSYIGTPCEDEGETLGLHGRLAATPAEEVGYRTERTDDSIEFVINGKVRETRLFGENLTLERTIRCRYGENVLRIEDKVTNHGFTRQPLQILYHFNYGWPLLSPQAEILLSAKSAANVQEVSRFAALIVATAFMFLGGMLALMIKLLPWLLLAVAVVWVIRAIKAPKVPKYQRYDRWRY